MLDPAPAVQLRTGDGAELHLADVPVTVTIASGGGTLSGTMTRPTDGDGRVQFGDLAISGDPGPRTLLFARGRLRQRHVRSH